MARIFLSYAHDDVDAVQQLALLITQAGHDVWWDRHLHGGSRFTTEIDNALKNAEAVVVLWSQASIDSAWVQDEAAEGRDTGRLVPVVIDSARPPLGFRQYHTIDLGSWNGNCNAEVLGELLDAISCTSGANTRNEYASVSKPEKKRSNRSICVLPFANMSGEPEQEYFSDGISEDITTDLSKISALEVVARNTAFTFKGQSLDVKEVAKSLGVSHVLEGSVRKSGSRVRINAQLIDGATGNHLWADRFDRNLTDIFDIQDEISAAIVGALKVTLLPTEKEAIENRGTANVEAYNLYLMARQYWVSGNYGDPKRDERVIRICKRAIELDPNYGRAWALLALAQADYSLDFGNLGENGLAAAERALEIDPSISEAHCVKAQYLASEGRRSEADREIEIALSLDPESWDVNSEAGRQAFLTGKMDDATRFFEKATSLMDNDFRSWGVLTSCYRVRGDHAAVRHASKVLIEKSKKALAEDSSNGSALGMIAIGLALLGEKERAHEWISRSLLLDPDNMRSRYNFACALANELGEPEAALDILEPLYEKLGPALIEHYQADPDLDPIRDDKRFIDGIARATSKCAAAPSATAASAPFRS